MANVTTLARVKAHLSVPAGESVTAETTARDALLTTLIAAVSRDFEAFLSYPVTEAARTERYDIEVNQRVIFLRVIPVVSIAEVKVGPSNWDYAGLTALVADQDYRLGQAGELFLNFAPRGGFQKAQVTYTAGLGANDEAIATAAPELALAANIQVAEEWRRRTNPSTVSVPGPKGSKVLDAPHRLLPRVRELLSGKRRLLCA